MSSAVCNGCGEPIVWVPSPSGKKHPANVDELQVVVEKGGPLRVILADGSVKAARLANQPDMMDRAVSGRASHFASCPHANRFRAAKGRTAP